MYYFMTSYIYIYIYIYRPEVTLIYEINVFCIYITMSDVQTLTDVKLKINCFSEILIE